jgi:mannose-6-phosphate isomerase-like protein (cupin superfamily)
MAEFATMRLAEAPAVTAPDGSDVRPLLALAGGSMAHFELAPGRTSAAVAHRTVEELWFCLGGRGELWRRQGGREETVVLEPGVCATIPLGAGFQFRAAGDAPLRIVAVTLPPWPGDGEAFAADGPWTATPP